MTTAPLATVRPGTLLKTAFIHLGILPFLLVGVVIFFALNESRFLSSLNIFNVARQSTFLIIIAMGQAVVLLTAGLDLSVGAVVGFAGVVTALILKSMGLAFPEATALVFATAIAGGIAAGLVVGLINGIGVALLNVPPFMMTLGTMTSLVGVALSMTKGLPVTQIPDDFMRFLGYGRVLGMAPAVFVTLILFAAMWLLLNRTTVGRYFYAVGSNIRAAQLSGINTRRQLMLAYLLSSLMAAIVGVLFLARTGSAEALNGQPYGLQSVAACVIAGVSLFGGNGKVRDVLLGALFIVILTNGMNLIRVESYVQQIVLGAILILALIADQIRTRLIAG
ncbi:ABC transporter permease (plasmid) [Gemmobacter fulvus]|uniref:ABC transporter permease n=1 Tax=Gemmobacter fulvus TaxID=2840474 RepID=A0A975PAI0_9RHOB|nr:ABC transporter permease [Gemmobacter fulvus]MBT9246231.1 ABC transporter permease [Gemmobacter fulvus]MDQ1850194.1 ABC transporter permease [Gemmobacter fulvus]QWK92412.1 ABC transporter permease [Gemmobacter fulvus]